jgi:hypothetical protein
MHKIHCPRCGVVNLEKFVTYPRCAGCGITLPQTEGEQYVPFWKRPLNSRLWITLVGSVFCGLLVGASFLQTSVEKNQVLLLYGNAARSGKVGDLVTLTLTADAPPSRHSAVLSDVRLRMPLRCFQSLRLVSISPQPDEMTVSGNSRYFSYRRLPRETNLILRLRAVAPISERFRATLYAADHMPAAWRITIRIQPAGRSGVLAP